MIIGYEHMHFYAIASIIDSCLKLAVVIILQYLNYDKLIVWGALTFLISFFSRVLFRTYAKRNFSSCKIEFKT